jgi:hypothetical protein
MDICDAPLPLLQEVHISTCFTTANGWLLFRPLFVACKSSEQPSLPAFLRYRAASVIATICIHFSKGRGLESNRDVKVSVVNTGVELLKFDYLV